MYFFLSSDVTYSQGLHLVTLLTNVNLLIYAGRRNLCMLIVCE